MRADRPNGRRSLLVLNKDNGTETAPRHNPRDSLGHGSTLPDGLTARSSALNTDECSIWSSLAVRLRGAETFEHATAAGALVYVCRLTSGLQGEVKDERGFALQREGKTAGLDRCACLRTCARRRFESRFPPARRVKIDENRLQTNSLSEPTPMMEPPNDKTGGVRMGRRSDGSIRRSKMTTSPQGGAFGRTFNLPKENVRVRTRLDFFLMWAGGASAAAALLYLFDATWTAARPKDRRSAGLTRNGWKDLKRPRERSSAHNHRRASEQHLTARRRPERPDGSLRPDALVSPRASTHFTEPQVRGAAACSMRRQNPVDPASPPRQDGSAATDFDACAGRRDRDSSARHARWTSLTGRSQSIGGEWTAK